MVTFLILLWHVLRWRLEDLPVCPAKQKSLKLNYGVSIISVLFGMVKDDPEPCPSREPCSRWPQPTSKCCFMQSVWFFFFVSFLLFLKQGLASLCRQQPCIVAQTELNSWKSPCPGLLPAGSIAPPYPPQMMLMNHTFYRWESKSSEMVSSFQRSDFTSD